MIVKTKKYYYKVVDKNYGSIICQSTKFRLTYKIGKKTIPIKGTKIFIFNSLRTTRDFLLLGFVKGHVLKVQAFNPKPQKIVAIWTDAIHINKFWANKLVRPSIFSSPYGTYGATAVIPIKEINIKEGDLTI